MLVKRGFSIFDGKRVLLLQGPVGPFFSLLARDLRNIGAHVSKVNFNGGDWFFYPLGAHNFRGSMQDWPDYFKKLLDKSDADYVIFFGDCRPIHKQAHEIAHGRGVEVCVFEEGYVRPDYVTFEMFGVNHHSQIPREPEFYFNNEQESPVEAPIHLGSTYWHVMFWAVLYYFFAGLFKPMFLRYVHHRPLTWLELLPFLRSFWRKGYYALKERKILKRLVDEWDERIFLVPLQVHNDTQITTHSDYDEVGQFITEVIRSFARCASVDTILVFKHHPFDRGYYDYTTLICRLSVESGVKDRCLYIHDQHLPTLMRHTRGVVVVNSTVGLSALHHGNPLKVCGRAVFDMPGLSFQGSLDEFWNAAPQSKPDARLVSLYSAYLVTHTQLNGSFYKKLPFENIFAGLRWKPTFAVDETDSKSTN